MMLTRLRYREQFQLHLVGQLGAFKPAASHLASP